MLHLMMLRESLRARLAAHEEGQGMVEYGLIIAAVAIAVIIAIFALGPKIASMFSSAGASLSSDRNKKANFAAVNAREVLARVVSLPIETWNYLSQGPAVRHIGPMAQDFHKAFGVGEDDTHINMVDANGVALAAIQGLYQLVQEQEMQLTVLEARLAALEARERELTLA
ncbi:MAG TPA: tail fiber domain-containing protein [Chloroflexota bacterium]|nr:tail fiber domain-containing protein [Chloroflexota bacterium]